MEGKTYANPRWGEPRDISSGNRGIEDLRLIFLSETQRGGGGVFPPRGAGRGCEEG